MVKNLEGPPQQRTEQSSESAARKQVAVRACQDRAQSKFKKKKKKKKPQSGNNHAANAEEQCWKRPGGEESGAWMENKQMGIGSGGNSSVALMLPSSSQEGMGVSGMSVCKWHPLGDWLGEVMTAGSEAMGQTLS